MKLTLLILLAFIPAFASSQNLVPNADLEMISSCPSLTNPFPVVDWIVPTPETTDFFNSCNTGFFGIPSNYIGNQASGTGDSYAGFVSYATGLGNYREYLQAALTSPTVPGCYELSVYYSHADECSFTDGIELHLSNGVPSTYLGLPAQLSESMIIADKTNWIVLTTPYVSLGGETHVTVGNFRTDANTAFQTAPGGFNSFGYIYIDSVAVEFVGVQSNNVMVDLGPDLDVCPQDFPLTITSNYPNAYNAWSTGETGNSIDVMDAGVYYLTVIDNCELNSDSIEISVIPEPVIELDEDQVLCEGESFTIMVDPSLGTYTWPDGSNGSEYTVTEAGTYEVDLTYACGTISDEIVVDVLYDIEIPEIVDYGLCSSVLPIIINLEEFNDGTNIFDWSDGSSGPALVINEAGEYDVSIFNDCFSDNESFTVEVDDPLPFEIPFDVTMACEGEEVLIFTGLTGADLIWQDGSTENFYLAEGPGIYVLTAFNSCGISEYQFIIEPVAPEVLEVGDNVSICPGDSVLLYSLNGEFLNWDNGASGTAIWVSIGGTYIATLEGQCEQVFDTIEVSLDGSAPVINLPDSILLCGGDSILLEPSLAISGVDFEWSTGSVDPSITVSTGGVFTVTGVNNCGIASDSVYITLGEALPQFDLTPLTEICPGDTVSYMIENENVTIEWSTGSTDSIIKVYEEGLYWVDLTNSCASVSDSFEVIFLPELTQHDLGQDLAICQGDSVTIDGPIIDGNYYWNTTENTQSIVVNTPGTYWLEISNSCSILLDSIVVEDLGQSPNVSLGADVSFCLGDTVFVTATGDFENVTWNTGPNTAEIAIFDEGIYIVEVNNACGIDYDTIEAVLNLEPPTIEIGEDQFICPGDSVLLDVGNVAGIIAWSNGSDQSSTYVDEAGLVTVSLSSSCGLSLDTVLVSFLDEIPILDLGEDIELCPDEILDVNLVFSVPVDIEWQDGDNSPDQQFAEAGIYWVEITNSCGLDRDSIELTYVPAIEDWQLPQDQLICDENSYIISPDIIPDNVTFMWDNSTDDPSLEVTQSGSYSLTIFNQCESATDDITVLFESSPSSFSLGATDTICQGESIILAADQGTEFNYEWQDGSDEVSFEVTQTGIYTLEISNICGLETAEVEIIVLPDSGFDVDIKSSYLFCEEDDLLIDLANSLANQIIWNDGGNELEKLITEPGNYFIELFNDCRDTLINFVLEKENCQEGNIFIPNVFSPNEDGINDFFSIGYPQGFDLQSSKVRIYNRWGELVFYSEDPDFKWYGNFKNKSLNPGVYVYTLEIEREVEMEIEKAIINGDLTITK